ncbi:unnamed protein product, partial [Adineta steineri]
MARSKNRASLFDRETKRFNRDGNIYVRAFFNQNPKPNKAEMKRVARKTGCTVKKLRQKLISMRYRYNRNMNKALESMEELINFESAHLSEISSFKEEAELSILAMQFLKFINPEEAACVINVILSKIKPKYIIGRGPVNKKIILEDINSWTSDTSIDGNYFADWVKCYTTPDDLKQIPPAYSRTTFYINKNTSVKVYNHHLVLRAVTFNKEFEVLSATGDKC